jgi:hypothetical protein
MVIIAIYKIPPVATTTAVSCAVPRIYRTCAPITACVPTSNTMDLLVAAVADLIAPTLEG